MQRKLVVTDLSVQAVGPMFEGQAVQIEYRGYLHIYTQLCMQ
jgi:hypothetical protein